MPASRFSAARRKSWLSWLTSAAMVFLAPAAAHLPNGAASRAYTLPHDLDRRAGTRPRPLAVASATDHLGQRLLHLRAAARSRGAGTGTDARAVLAGFQPRP